ncbi:conserved hypothetical protein [Ricinus communis]|uniref:Uncharacterized protein n=1 Tax=Ricinus communis TaxID=3988 RepID=B9SW72_RICCO|nr:conserved hypothetical protein [Ricinus communis]
MELKPPKPTRHHRQPQTLPPRRGQVKVRIIKEVVKSVSAFFGKRGRPSGDGGGGFTTSNSSTPATISSGYNSDAPSDS